jgi:hypothetical protein
VTVVGAMSLSLHARSRRVGCWELAGCALGCFSVGSRMLLLSALKHLGSQLPVFKPHIVCTSQSYCGLPLCKTVIPAHFGPTTRHQCFQKTRILSPALL